MNAYPQYKESGVEWIEEIPAHWEVKTISQTAQKITNGYVGPTRDILRENGVKYLQSLHIKNNSIIFNKPYFVDKEWSERHDRSILRKNDLLIVQTGDIGQVTFVTDEFVGCNCHALIIVTVHKDYYSGQYVSWLLNSNYGFHSLRSIQTGALHPHLNSGAIKYIKIPIPPLTEQTAIATYLDRKTTQIDTLITKKQRLIKLLGEERTAIISHAVTKGLDATVPLKDSGVEWIGQIPAHWQIAKLKYAFHFLDHRRIPMSADERGKMSHKIYDYYGASGVIDKVDDYIFTETTILVGEDGANLISRSSRLAFIAKGKYWVNNHAHILLPKTGHIHYFVELLECIDYSNYITGSAQPKLTQDNLGNVIIVVPPQAEQTAIATYLDGKTTQIDVLIAKTRKLVGLLQEYRTALISSVVTGKVDVREEVMS